MNDALMIELEESLENQGWGRPGRLFVVNGTVQEPVFELLAEIEGHPCDALIDMWRIGVRLKGEPIALALVAEGDRHLRYEELQERAADMLKRLTEEAQDDGLTDEEVQTSVRNAWQDVTDSTPAQLMPEHLRVRVRNSVAVVEDGWTLMVIRDQDGAPEVLSPVPPDRLKLSRVPHFMWLFLTGREPKD